MTGTQAILEAREAGLIDSDANYVTAASPTQPPRSSRPTWRARSRAVGWFIGDDLTRLLAAAKAANALTL